MSKTVLGAWEKLEPDTGPLRRFLSILSVHFTGPAKGTCGCFCAYNGIAEAVDK